MDIDINLPAEELLGAVPTPVQIPTPAPGEYVPRISEDNFDQDAWDEWYREQIRLSIEDPRPDIPHEQVMREMHELVEEFSADASPTPR
ncbi:hypothetical protein [Mitsuaria sp. GD03876]|uniref:antitoxin PaaA2 family protein n=1 Tax=Mitsuaria sp. GD03876 TaxID=2975399 RepID=UPI00244A56E4|nr:hypothetical protein [Mitsuaria sp. GD03876]MDH0864962.1 hypothetical protein [Mitsuaria sp. GD03876]